VAACPVKPGFKARRPGGVIAGQGAQHVNKSLLQHFFRVAAVARDKKGHPVDVIFVALEQSFKGSGLSTLVTLYQVFSGYRHVVPLATIQFCRLHAVRTTKVQNQWSVVSDH
jgi:hypothetical protein